MKIETSISVAFLSKDKILDPSQHNVHYRCQHNEHYRCYSVRVNNFEGPSAFVPIWFHLDVVCKFVFSQNALSYILSHCPIIYWICLDFFPRLLKNPIFQYFSVNDSLAFQSALGQLGNVVHRDYRGNQIYSKFAGLQEEESLHRFQVHEPMNYHQLDHCYY